MSIDVLLYRIVDIRINAVLIRENTCRIAKRWASWDDEKVRGVLKDAFWMR